MKLKDLRFSILAVAVLWLFGGPLYAQPVSIDAAKKEGKFVISFCGT